MTPGSTPIDVGFPSAIHGADQPTRICSPQAGNVTSAPTMTNTDAIIYGSTFMSPIKAPPALDVQNYTKMERRSALLE